jgi:hypothetical protein
MFTYGTEAEIVTQEANCAYGANVILTRGAFLEILQAARNWKAATNGVSAGYQPLPLRSGANPIPPGAE